jgi:energy-coupling factor transport system permease protein
MTYTRRASPLHVAAAPAGGAFCLALAAAALAVQHPIVLLALLAIIAAAAAGASVLGDLGRAARFGLVPAFLLAALNPLVASQGLTVIARLPHVPILVHDVTLEATAYGGVLGLRLLTVLCACALGALCVDPDEVLRVFRRLSLRSALTAALATRMVPVLARDARRLADAQRTRPGAGASRVALARAVAAGALDRAVDVAATLEVRGYGAARRAAREPARPSRHDLAFGAAAGAVVALVAGARVAGIAGFDAYPLLAMSTGVGEAALCVALAVVALAPFADRRGIDR